MAGRDSGAGRQGKVVGGWGVVESGQEKYVGTCHRSTGEMGWGEKHA